MRKELQLLEHWLRLLASHADIGAESFDEIHALCRGISDDLDILEDTARNALLACQAQHERICDLERVVSDLVAEGEAQTAWAEWDADIKDRLSRARLGH